ncbi:MAG: PQQ-dependent sugar dehydrogenase [Chloroflexi bacterium]|nr:PQQ-dependent sugar dehydrogenase [Chloroflexota bacterium]
MILLLTLGTVSALDQSLMPGGAPEPRSGPFQPRGFVRVIDGDTFEVTIDGRRVYAGVLGIVAPPFGTECGTAARSQLQALIGRGVILRDDPANLFDARKRRLYVVQTVANQSVAVAMLQAGLARTTGIGPEAAAMAAAEAKARQDGTGCVWGGPLPAPRTAAGRVGIAAAGTVLTGFADETMASGLNFPTGFAFLPTSNRVLVLEKEGLVRLVENGVLATTPVLDLRSSVNSYHDRGLLGLALHPGFGSNGYFYLYYTYEHNAADPAGPKTNRVVRYTLAGNTANPASAQVILGSVSGSGCPAGPSDCLPADDISHDGGSLRFDSNGYLFVSTGDAANFGVVDALALRAQDSDSLAGKILRVTDTGQGISSNPWWNGNAGHTNSKLWAKGFRNPFRIVLKPGTNMPFVGDVGWSEREEIDVIPAGANAGWPCYEGSQVQAGYQGFPVCTALYSQGPSAVKAPLLEWNHDGWQAAALAGTFYTANVFPPTYQNALFYLDYARGWINSVRINASNQLEGAPNVFATDLGGPVQLEMASDGSLWYLAIGPGELRRIRFAGSYTPLSCPDGQFRAEYYQNETLAGAPSYQACEATINHDWGGGPPTAGFGDDHFSVRWIGRFTFSDGVYDFTARSDDGARVWIDGEQIVDDWGSGAANNVVGTKTMTAGQHTVMAEYWDDCCAAEMRLTWAPRIPNAPPAPTITSPTVSQQFKVGDVIQLSGSATDVQDGTIPTSGLRWDVILKHCPGFGAACHDHPFVTLNGATAQFTVPDHGDGSFFEVRLTATDNGGLTTTVTRQLNPQTVQVTINTLPPGAAVLYDSATHTAPFSTTTVAGSTHTIGVTAGSGEQFVSWGHGGAQQQNVTVGVTDVVYTATLGPTTTPTPPPSSACAPRPRVNMATAVVGTGRLQVTVSTSSHPGFATNTLKSIQFQQATRAAYEIPGQPAGAGPYTVTYPNGTTQTTFVVQRTAAGAAMARFTVTDDCGSWPTFVGSGGSGGW